MKKYLVGIIAIALFGYATIGLSAASNTTDTRFYIAPMASYGFFNEDTSRPEDHVGAQLSFGKTLTSHLALELYGFNYSDVDTPGFGSNSHANIWGVGLSALLFPARDILPVFAVAGVGTGQDSFRHTTNSQSRQNANFYDVGAGLLIPLSSHIDIRAEYRFRVSTVDHNGGGHYKFRDNIVSLGIQIPLGTKPGTQPVAQPAPAPAPVVPAPAPKTEPAPPKDSDGDGIPDNQDKCPGTPANTNVDKTGCKIANLPTVLKGVHFKLSSDELTPDAKARLDDVAAALKKAPDVPVRIGGHTDSTGGAALNMRLSKQRADSVMKYLIKQGVDSDRLSTVGYGETRPIAPNTKPDGSDNPAGRAQNRRVEIHLVRH